MNASSVLLHHTPCVAVANYRQLQGGDRHPCASDSRALGSCSCLTPEHRALVPGRVDICSHCLLGALPPTIRKCGRVHATLSPTTRIPHMFSLTCPLALPKYFLRFWFRDVFWFRRLRQSVHGTSRVRQHCFLCRGRGSRLSLKKEPPSESVTWRENFANSWCHTSMRKPLEIDHSASASFVAILAQFILAQAMLAAATVAQTIFAHGSVLCDLCLRNLSG